MRAFGLDRLRRPSGSSSGSMRKAVHQMLPSKGGRSSTRNTIKELYIQLDKPHNTFRAGEEASGQIILILNENMANIMITLSLVGVIKLHSNTPLRSDRKENLFNHEILLYGDTENNELALTKGEHRFPFIVKLPKKNVHTSISFGKGEIKYTLKAELCNKLDNEAKIANAELLLTIIKPINLTLLPEAQPKTLTFRNTRKNFKHSVSSTSSIYSTDSWELQQGGPGTGSSNNNNTHSQKDGKEIRIKLEIPSMGYLKGESIPVKLFVRHYKHITNVNGIFITLIRVCSLDLGEEHELQSFRKDLVQSIVPLIINPDSSATYEVSTTLRVPSDSFPTIVSNLVSFQYYVEVLLNLSNSSPKVQKPEMIDDEVIQLDSTDNIYNVDKLKQMKNVLTLTSEIVIGTERKEISKVKKHRKHSSHETLQSPTETSVASTTYPSSTTASSASQITLPAIPSARSPQSAHEEKEYLRLRTQALLPSEPPDSSPAYTSADDEAPPLPASSNTPTGIDSPPQTLMPPTDPHGLPAYAELDPCARREPVDRKTQ